MICRLSVSPLSRRAFSLVELSIVLVILGLLAGGILAGQSLIRASELRAAGSEYNRYQTAVQAFRDKYFALPGDMTNATSFWGKDATDCNGQTGTAATPGTCNGNGDGIIGYPGSASTQGEAFMAWQHLADAGLVEGNYSGLAGPGISGDYLIGTNCPTSKIAGAGWMLTYRDNSAGGTNTHFNYDYRNWLGIGADVGGGGAYLSAPIFKTEEAWNIDSKFDDGLPATGRVHGWAGTASVTVCTTATSQTDRTGSYKLSDSSPALCLLLFKY